MTDLADPTIRSRRVPFAVAALLVSLGALLSGCTSGADGRASDVANQGFVSGDGTVAQLTPTERTAPVRFTGTTLQGDPFDLADLRGKVVVVNVWASWCAPCIAEAPALQAVRETTSADDVAFIGINSKDREADALAHERRFGVTYPSVSDDGGRALLALRGLLPPKAIPTTLVLDRTGRVAARALNEVDRVVLAELVGDVLAEDLR